MLELFSGIDGPTLLTMTCQDFEALEPKRGKLVYSIIRRLCKSAPDRRSMPRSSSREDDGSFALTSIVEGRETDSPPIPATMTCDNQDKGGKGGSAHDERK